MAVNKVISTVTPVDGGNKFPRVQQIVSVTLKENTDHFHFSLMQTFPRRTQQEERHIPTENSRTDPSVHPSVCNGDVCPQGNMKNMKDMQRFTLTRISKNSSPLLFLSQIPPINSSNSVDFLALCFTSHPQSTQEATDNNHT